MKYAVIAAGEGSRLAAEGIDSPKPLVRVAGEMLIDRLIRVFMDNDAEEIVVICNDLTTQVSHHLLDIQQNGLKGRPVPLRFVVKSTPSSMHSFYEISRYLTDGPFCLTTVDTIFREPDFARYIAAFEADTENDGMMAVTPFIDDEKPLYVETDDQMNIVAFRDAAWDGAKYVSGGIYALNEKSFGVVKECIDNGVSRMRNFQRALVSSGLKLKAYSIDKIIDVDHAEDIATAQKFISE